MVAVIVGFLEVVTPADNTLERIVAVEHSREIDLAPFAEDHLFHRHFDIDLATGNIRYSHGFTGHRGGRYEKRAKECGRGTYGFVEHTYLRSQE